MNRFALAYHYTPHITIEPKSVSLALNDKNGITIFNGIRSTGKDVRYSYISKSDSVYSRWFCTFRITITQKQVSTETASNKLTFIFVR